MCLHLWKVSCLKLFPITRNESLKAHPNIIMSDYTFTKGKRKTPLEGTIKIYVRLPHPRNHVLSGQEKGGTQIAHFAKEWIGCTSINVIEEGPNEKMFKGFKVKNPFEGELDKPNNVFQC